MIENENSRIVVGEGGWRGRLDALPHPDSRYVVVHPEDREPALILPMDLFDQHQNGTFHVPLTRSDATARSLDISSGRAWEGQKRGSVSAENGSGFGTEQIVVPVIEELIEVRKQMVDTANVRVIKTVHEHERDDT